MGVVHSFATPVNDAFASASVLSPALPSTAVGSNIAATTEAGELLPGLTRRTVWWSWTPTVGGWVRVSTRGTNIDTVLSAFTGSTLSGLTRRAFNDDVGGADTGSGRSELIFLASAGETYRVQVGGFAGWEGTFALDLAAASIPPQLTKLSFTPVAADVSSQAASVTSDLGVTHPAGLRFGRLSVFRPDGTPEDEASLDSTTRISGTAAVGTYRVAITIQQRVQPGNYTLRVDLNGLDSRRAVYGERTPFPVGLPRTIPVINTGVIDAQPPVLALDGTYAIQFTIPAGALPGPQKWLRLRVTDPADYPAH